MADPFILNGAVKLSLDKASVSQLVSNFQSQTTGLTLNANVKINGSRAATINALNQAFTGLNTTLGSVNANAANVAKSFQAIAGSFNTLKSASSQVAGGLSGTTRTVTNLGQAVNQTGTAFERLGESAFISAKRFTAFGIAAGSIYAFINALKSGVQYGFDFDKTLIQLQQVSGRSAASVKQIGDEISRVATTFGVSSEQIGKAAVTLAQAGFNARQLKDSLEVLAKTELAPNFKSLENTVEGVIAITSQFKIGSQDLGAALGSVNAVAAQFAVESEDIIKAVRKAGGAFKAAGGDFNQFIALFTSIRATTRESAETIATALNTIFARVRRPDTVNALKDIGIELEDLNHNFVGPYEATIRLNKALADINPQSQKFSQLAEALGGLRQISKVIPLLQQGALAQAAYNTALAGTNSLDDDFVKSQKALYTELTKTKEAFFDLFKTITQDEGFKSFIKLTNELVRSLISLTKVLTPLLPVFGAIAAVKGFQAAKGIASGAAAGFSTFIKRKGGGLIPGEGNYDSVPTLLQPGEYVLPKKVVQRIGADNLYAINQQFASGGAVFGGPKPDSLDKIGDVSRIRRLIGDTRAQYLAAYRNARFANRFGSQSNAVQSLFEKLSQHGVLALTTPGEFVMSKEATAHIGIGTLDKVNNSVKRYAKGGMVRRYAAGGVVGGITDFINDGLVNSGVNPFTSSRANDAADQIRESITKEIIANEARYLRNLKGGITEQDALNTATKKVTSALAAGEDIYRTANGQFSGLASTVADFRSRGLSDEGRIGLGTNFTTLRQFGTSFARRNIGLTAVGLGTAALAGVSAFGGSNSLSAGAIGAGTGGIAGGLLGAQVGGVPGAVVGGLVGAFGGLLGGLQRFNRELRDTELDKFNDEIDSATRRFENLRAPKPEDFQNLTNLILTNSDKQIKTISETDSARAPGFIPGIFNSVKDAFGIDSADKRADRADTENRLKLGPDRQALLAQANRAALENVERPSQQLEQQVLDLFKRIGEIDVQSGRPNQTNVDKEITNENIRNAALNREIVKRLKEASIAEALLNAQILKNAQVAERLSTALEDVANHAEVAQGDFEQLASGLQGGLSGISFKGLVESLKNLNSADFASASQRVVNSGVLGANGQGIRDFTVNFAQERRNLEQILIETVAQQGEKNLSSVDALDKAIPQIANPLVKRLAEAQKAEFEAEDKANTSKEKVRRSPAELANQILSKDAVEPARKAIEDAAKVLELALNNLSKNIVELGHIELRTRDEQAKLADLQINARIAQDTRLDRPFDPALIKDVVAGLAAKQSNFTDTPFNVRATGNAVRTARANLAGARQAFQNEQDPIKQAQILQDIVGFEGAIKLNTTALQNLVGGLDSLENVLDKQIDEAKRDRDSKLSGAEAIIRAQGDPKALGELRRGAIAANFINQNGFNGVPGGLAGLGIDTVRKFGTAGQKQRLDDLITNSSAGQLTGVPSANANINGLFAQRDQVTNLQIAAQKEIIALNQELSKSLFDDLRTGFFSIFDDIDKRTGTLNGVFAGAGAAPIVGGVGGGAAGVIQNEVEKAVQNVAQGGQTGGGSDAVVNELKRIYACLEQLKNCSCKGHSGGGSYSGGSYSGGFTRPSGGPTYGGYSSGRSYTYTPPSRPYNSFAASSGIPARSVIAPTTTSVSPANNTIPPTSSFQIPLGPHSPDNGRFPEQPQEAFDRTIRNSLIANAIGVPAAGYVAYRAAKGAVNRTANSQVFNRLGGIVKAGVAKPLDYLRYLAPGLTRQRPTTFPYGSQGGSVNFGVLGGTGGSTFNTSGGIDAPYGPFPANPVPSPTSTKTPFKIGNIPGKNLPERLGLYSGSIVTAEDDLLKMYSSGIGYKGDPNDIKKFFNNIKYRNTQGFNDLGEVAGRDFSTSRGLFNRADRNIYLRTAASGRIPLSQSQVQSTAFHELTHSIDYLGAPGYRSEIKGTPENLVAKSYSDYRIGKSIDPAFQKAVSTPREGFAYLMQQYIQDPTKIPKEIREQLESKVLPGYRDRIAASGKIRGDGFDAAFSESKTLRQIEKSLGLKSGQGRGVYGRLINLPPGATDVSGFPLGGEYNPSNRSIAISGSLNEYAQSGLFKHEYGHAIDNASDIIDASGIKRTGGFLSQVKGSPENTFAEMFGQGDAADKIYNLDNSPQANKFRQYYDSSNERFARGFREYVNATGGAEGHQHLTSDQLKFFEEKVKPRLQTVAGISSEKYANPRARQEAIKRAAGTLFDQSIPDYENLPPGYKINIGSKDLKGGPIGIAGDRIKAVGKSVVKNAPGLGFKGLGALGIGAGTLQIKSGIGELGEGKTASGIANIAGGSANTIVGVGGVLPSVGKLAPLGVPAIPALGAAASIPEIVAGAVNKDVTQTGQGAYNFAAGAAGLAYAPAALAALAVDQLPRLLPGSKLDTGHGLVGTALNTSKIFTSEREREQSINAQLDESKRNRAYNEADARRKAALYVAPSQNFADFSTQSEIQAGLKKGPLQQGLSDLVGGGIEGVKGLIGAAKGFSLPAQVDDPENDFRNYKAKLKAASQPVEEPGLSPAAAALKDLRANRGRVKYDSELSPAAAALRNLQIANIDKTRRRAPLSESAQRRIALRGSRRTNPGFNTLEDRGLGGGPSFATLEDRGLGSGPSFTTLEDRSFRRGGSSGSFSTSENQQNGRTGGNFKVEGTAELGSNIERMNATITQFNQGVERLAKLQGLEIVGKFTHDVNVNINGAQVLAGLEPKIKEMVTTATEAAIGAADLTGKNKVT